ncbi:M50 family metallopeptidase [Pseudonocardia eucalypti]|uniref:M50 family metallopeptidase n=1 Tax=Pseudonocardia eucalypti TaxID=648755 RepID=A0ABP9PKR9_9PSEU|nr:membrane-associated protease RseP (regulator of RpoE activity) [Pseudonocardia eucalypti]
MSFALGVVLFALGIGLSVALHEAGHMWSARAFGMKVRRYFVGMGPTVFSYRRGETEYGLKWLPIGGFCDIAGMTALDPVTVDEAPRAFFTRKTWKRVVVLCAGSAMHFLLGIALIYALAVSFGLPDTREGAVAGQTACVPSSQDPTTLQYASCAPADASPAQRAGIQPGDRILSVAGTPTPTWEDAVETIRRQTGPVPFVIERGDRQLTLQVDVVQVQRADTKAKPGQHNPLTTVGAIGLGAGILPPNHYNALTAIPGTVVFTGYMFEKTWEGLLMFPEKVPAVLRAIGGETDPNRPVSVVGVSIIGGDAVDQGQWPTFLMLLAVFNFFIGVFNLLPLLPLDGGHVAVNLYERVRDSVRRRLGKPKMPPVDYTRLLPLTYVFILIIGGISLLTITADIVNPIRLQ